MCFFNICIFEYFPMIIIFKKQFKKSQQLTSHFKREPNSYNNLHELHRLIICLTQLPRLFNLTLVKTDSALPPTSHDSPTVIPFYLSLQPGMLFFLMYIGHSTSSKWQISEMHHGPPGDNDHSFWSQNSHTSWQPRGHCWISLCFGE